MNYTIVKKEKPVSVSRSQSTFYTDTVYLVKRKIFGLFNFNVLEDIDNNEGLCLLGGLLIVLDIIFIAVFFIIHDTISHYVLSFFGLLSLVYSYIFYVCNTREFRDIDDARYYVKEKMKEAEFRKKIKREVSVENYRLSHNGLGVEILDKE